MRGEPARDGSAPRTAAAARPTPGALVARELARVGIVRKSQLQLEFWCQVIMDCLWYASHVAVFEVFYGQVDVIAGWQRHEFRVLLGHLLLTGGLGAATFGSAEMLVLAATLSWSAEVILLKRVLPSIAPEIAAAARMAGGSVLLVAWLKRGSIASSA